MRRDAFVGLVHGDVLGGHRAQHLEDQPDRGVVVVAGVRAPEHGVDRTGEPHPLAQRNDVGRQGLLQIAVAVEHVGQGARVEGREATRKVSGGGHRS